MRKAIFSAAVILAISGSAIAAPGGEGNNTGCNGTGNPGSPCEGVGGTGGAAFTNTFSPTNTNTVTGTNTNTNRNTVTTTNTNNNSNVANGGTARSSSRAAASTGAVTQQVSVNTGGAAVPASVGATGAGSIPSTVTIRNTPDVYAPPLSGGANPCVVGASAGGSGPGFGISFGMTTSDPGCERRNLAVVLNNMGMRDVAVEVLCADTQVRAAMSRAGAPCMEDRQRQAVQQVAVTPVSTPAPTPAPARNRPAFCSVPGLSVSSYPECN